jgi:Tat protein secretion system quality control protein TatD with DNase activity
LVVVVSKFSILLPIRQGTKIKRLTTRSSELLALADEDNIIAIGETGLDYFHVEKDTADWQRDRSAKSTLSK